MKIPLPKLKALIRYFGTYTDGRFLGITKLMKLMYFVDFLHVKKYGSPITYDTYVNLEHGPIPSTIMNLVNTAASDPDQSMLADTLSIERLNGVEMKRIVCTHEFDSNDERLFSSTELKILKEVVKRFGDKNTKFIEEASHKDTPWKTTKLLEEIPYALATEDPDTQVDKEDVELLLKI